MRDTDMSEVRIFGWFSRVIIECGGGNQSVIANRLLSIQMSSGGGATDPMMSQCLNNGIASDKVWAASFLFLKKMGEKKKIPPHSFHFHSHGQRQNVE